MGRDGDLSLMDDAGCLRHDIRVDDVEMRKNIADKLAKQDDKDVMVSSHSLLRFF